MVPGVTGVTGVTGGPYGGATGCPGAPGCPGTPGCPGAPGCPEFGQVITIPVPHGKSGLPRPCEKIKRDRIINSLNRVTQQGICTPQPCTQQNQIIWSCSSICWSR